MALCAKTGCCNPLMNTLLRGRISQILDWDTTISAEIQRDFRTGRGVILQILMSGGNYVISVNENQSAAAKRVSALSDSQLAKLKKEDSSHATAMKFIGWKQLD